MLRETVLVFAAVLAIAFATQVNLCESGEKFDDSNQVNITGCAVPPCKFRRRMKYAIEQKFAPKKDTHDLKNSVHALVLGVPLPFVGVDGTSACDSIFNTDGTNAGCTLKKDVEYVYKREFPILPIYPTISMVVHYAIVEDANNAVTCFEVPVKITN